MYIKFELVSKYNEQFTDFKYPKRATKGSTCYDIFNNTGNDIVIPAECTGHLVTTYLKVYLAPRIACDIYPRSSHGFKYGVRLANTVGIIDEDYYNNSSNEGEIFLKFRNPSKESITIKKGEAMAQARFSVYFVTDDDDETVGGERKGGIGSTTK